MVTKSKEAEAPVVTGASTAKYTLERLRLNCRSLFGISTSTFDGATYGMTGKYTVEEMRAHIESWKKEGAV
jgi:hypothetical protein